MFARSFLSPHSRSCWRSACHCLLGSFSDSLVASLFAGSSSSESIIVDTPRALVGAITTLRFPAFIKQRVTPDSLGPLKPGVVNLETSWHTRANPSSPPYPSSAGRTDLRPWKVYHDAGGLWFDSSRTAQPNTLPALRKWTITRAPRHLRTSAAWLCGSIMCSIWAL